MLKELAEFLRPREETVELGGQKITVREMATLEEFVSVSGKGPDAIYTVIARCSYHADGKLVFSEADIEALKKLSKVKLLPLINAVNRVNGFDTEGDAKKSEATPG